MEQQFDEEVLNQLVKLGADRNECIKASKLVQNPKDINQVFAMYNQLEEKQNMQQLYQNDEKKQNEMKQISIDQFTVPYSEFIKQYTYCNDKKQSYSSKTVYKVKSLNANDQRLYFLKKRTIGQDTTIDKIYMEYVINKSGISAKYINIYYNDKNQNVYILMKHLDYTLGWFILTHRNNNVLHKLNEKNTQFIAKCIGTELLKLHKLGYVHCDIKPHNIMYDKQLKKWHLIDFDLSLKNNTVKKYYFGTCSWSAAEHLYDNKQDNLFTNKCDIFTFGIILIYTLFGTQPFATWDQNNLKLLKHKYSKHPKKKYLQHCDLLKLYHPSYTNNAIQKLNQKIVSYQMSKELTDLIKKMLCYDPEKRIDIQGVMNHPWMNCQF